MSNLCDTDVVHHTHCPSVNLSCSIGSATSAKLSCVMALHVICTPPPVIHCYGNNFTSVLLMAGAWQRSLSGLPANSCCLLCTVPGLHVLLLPKHVLASDSSSNPQQCSHSAAHAFMITDASRQTRYGRGPGIAKIQRSLTMIDSSQPPTRKCFLLKLCADNHDVQVVKRSMHAVSTHLSEGLEAADG